MITKNLMDKLLVFGVIFSLAGCTLPFFQATPPPTATPSEIATATLAQPQLMPATETPVPTSTAIPLPTSTRVTPTLTSTPTLIPQFRHTPTSVIQLSPLTIEGSACLPQNTRVDLAIVLNVLSGDTIQVIVNGQKTLVGYLGIQAPTLPVAGRLGGFFAKDALQRNIQLVNGQIVSLVKDQSDYDSRGRLLRYVIVNSTFVNYALVAEGYAASIWPGPDSACKTEFDSAQVTARQNRTGMWITTPTPMYVPSGH